MAEPRTNVRWAYGYVKTFPMLVEAYTLALPEDSAVDASAAANTTWVTGRVPANVRSAIGDVDRARIEAMLGKLISCGCAQARHDLAAAVRSLDFLRAGRVAVAGISTMAENLERDVRVRYFKRKVNEK